MKKYPWSQKALRAMVATAVAFTPAVAIGGQATHVEAAQDELGTKISRLVAIYNNLSSEGVTVYNKAATALSGISDSDWEYVIGSTVKQNIDDKAGTGKAVEVAKALATIVYSANGSTLESQIRSFQTNYSDEFDQVFGASVTVDKLITFFTEAEKEVWNHLDQAIDLASNPSEEQYKSFIRTIRNGVESKNPSLATLDADLRNGIGAGLDDLFSMKTRLDEKLALTAEEKSTLKTALIAAIVATGNPYSSGGGSTGGGSVVTPPSTGVDNGKVNVGQDAVTTKEQTNSKGQKEKVTEVKVDKIADIVNLVSAQNKEIVLGVGALGANEVAKAEVPAKLFADVAAKEAKAVVNVQTDKASYKLPVAEIQAKLTEIAQKLGSSIDNVKIAVEITKVNPPQGVTAVSDAVEFNVVATANGKSETITRFTQYVERELKGSKVFVPQRSVAVRVDANGNLVSVPTVFNGDQATVKSLTNSTYVVVENNKTFVDVDNGKTWAEAYVEALASKYIIKGKTDQTFAPKENMTRAQFAVLLVRALGLPSETYDKRFKDVKGTEWFNENGELAAAVKHGIIQGKGNGVFAPNAPVTRAEAAVMFKRALELSFLNYDMTQLDSTKKVTDFTDASQVKTWAKDSVEKMYQAGIFTGRENKRFVPAGYMTRAEVAKALAEFLASAKLMNDVQ
ncbi:S-layer homology domain-containing protein [Anoxybacillus sp. LAT_35]|uniref:S-layer homology domain-containing protein n=1 Tax=Anoxybacillus TaxID=150247 RepID=UPI001EDC23E2|nr:MULTISPECIES: S-layer homology domain-containing protein [Anoxybacillus]MCG5026159.1 S-layer homology domain-containing protein [Anoxybacillus flavithermus]MCG6197124.1 S-layer homology domain-containing protein [Anoxybacillus sp. LAT_38]MCG3084108.1 S-layer homology domain-containing protein [Anoxybacillus sp. LAT27]MCG6171283.1 S-layer homology domain-containing protein [Anoxybacillus sp. LAT_11]MCG6175860.1 S-layer homology domain-containing protein [Anoxybacillus sp. LAT_31]